MHSSLIALALLGYLSESLPQLHHHEDQHACVEVEGLQHNQKIIPPETTSVSTEKLEGILLDDGHIHAHCALCQLLPSLLGISYSPANFEVNLAIAYSDLNARRPQSQFSAHRSRGPPLHYQPFHH